MASVPDADGRFFAVFAAASLVMVGFAVFTAGSCRADSWSDDFPGSSFDQRWTQGEIGEVLPDGSSHAWAKSFDPRPDNPIPEEDLPLWYGPSVTAALSLSGDFAVQGKFNCVADVADFNVGRLEIRLLDSSRNIVHAMGWADTSNSTNAVWLYVRGQGGSITYSTDEGYSFSNFIGKSMSLSRSGGEIAYAIEGSEVFRGTASSKGVKYVQVQFLRHKAGAIELMCTPNVMKLDKITVQSTAATVPGAPQSLSCSAGSGFANLSWLPPADTGGIYVASYRIYRGTATSEQTFLTSVGTQLYYNNTGLQDGITYYYWVSAVNEVGEGARAGPVNAASRSLPGPPTNLQAVAGADYVFLKWQVPLSDGGSAVTGYSIHRGAGPDSLVLLASVSAVLEYTDTAVTGQTLYYYAVGASNELGDGPLSEVTEAVPGAATSAPSAPRSLAAAPVNAAVKLVWSAPASSGNSPISNYTVYRGFNLQTMSLHVVLGNVLSFTDTGLQNGQKYHYSVSASNLVGEGNRSEAAEATPAPPSPPSPPHEISLAPGDGQMAISWSPPLDSGNSEITRYSVYRGSDAANQTLVASLGPVQTYTDAGLAAGKEYFYSMTATNSAGEGIASDTVSAMTYASGGGPDGPDWNSTEDSTGGWSLTSPFVTLIVMCIAVVGALLYFRRGGK